MKILLILLLNLLFLSSVIDSRRILLGGGKKNRSKKKGGTQSKNYKYGYDSQKHSTTACSSSSTKCNCDNRAYEVKIGSENNGFESYYSGPYQLGSYYGPGEVYCYEYLVTRVKGRYNQCAQKSLQSVIIGINTRKASCNQISCKKYRRMIYSANCECGSNYGCNSCCSVSVASESRLNVLGVKFSFKKEINKNNDAQAVTICVNNIYELDYGKGLIAYYMTDTGGFACDEYDIPKFCDGPGGPLDDCDEQDKCIEFEVNQITSGSSYGSGYSGYSSYSGSSRTTYEVCLWWDSSQYGCDKDGTISQVCYNQNQGDIIQGFPSISSGGYGYTQNKICKEVGCGEIAEFGVKDGKGCSSYYGKKYKEIRSGSGYRQEIYSGTCSYTGGYCGGYGNTDDCTWEISTPECTPEPTAPTPQPTWPTPKPTQPTPEPTPDFEICDCYSSTFIEVNDDDSADGESCWNYIISRPQNTLYSSFCNTALEFALLGTCPYGQARNLTDLITLIHGCDEYEVVDTIINGETIQGLKCDLGNDNNNNNIVTICFKDAIREEFGIVRQTAYQFVNGQAEICDEQDGLPDICKTLDPTIDPTSDPTNDPTTDPTTDPTVDPTSDPTVDPTSDPTNIPTYNPTSDPTYYPTWYPTTDPTYNPTDSPTQRICEPVENGEIELDVVLIADRSCRTDDDDDYCDLRQVFLAELMTRIKGADTSNGDDIDSRVAYFEYGYAPISTVIALDDADYNDGPIDESDIVDYYQEIKARGCKKVMPGATYKDLYSVINEAVDALDPVPPGSNTKTGTTKKIVVVSDCEETPGGTNSITDICDQDLIDDLRKKNIDVIFINLGETDGDVSDDYGSCLATPSNVYNPDIDEPDDIYDFVDVIDDEICEENTDSPTSFVFVFFVINKFIRPHIYSYISVHIIYIISAKSQI